MGEDALDGGRESGDGVALMCYTRHPTDRQEANNEDVALSMHLALRSRATGRWEPLNGDYGIFFAAAVPTKAVPDSARGACTAGAALPGESAPQEDERNPGLDAHQGEGSNADADDDENVDDGQASQAAQELAVVPGQDLILKSLIDPFLLPLRDGTFVILATRTARGGQSDGSQADSFLTALSPDLLTYRRLPQVHILGAHGVHRPRARLLDDGQGCRLYWDDDCGRLCTATVDDPTRMGMVADMEVLEDDDSLVQGDPLSMDRRRALEEDCGMKGILAGNMVLVSADCERGLLERFGRIYNTGVKVDPVQVFRGGGLESVRQAQARLLYSDGSAALRGVDWDQRQLDRLASDLALGRLDPGETRLIGGRVRQTAYPVPFARQRADPSIFRWSWRGQRLFMFIATEDADGNCVDPLNGRTHMPLRVADAIEGLSDQAGGHEKEVDLLRRGDRNSEGRVMTGCFWAPEIHLIGGRLSILFMPCFDGPRTNPDGTANDRAGKPDMWTGCCHIMQLLRDDQGRDLDPRQPGNWDRPRPILRAEGTPLNPIQRISLDMTVLHDTGRWYYAWQQLGSVWIAAFDPARPDRLTSMPRQIIVPEFAWDNMIAEGPNAVTHDGRIFLIYSGSLVGIDYTTGLVTAPAGVGADLCDPGVWKKLDYPLQKSGKYNGHWQLGTGHGMWSQDEDGTMIYVFHNAEHDQGRYLGRDSQVRRVHWSAEGMPVLDMQTDEELDPTRATVTLEVRVL